MAHKPETRELCKQLYLIEGKTPEQIAGLTKVALRTILRWRKQEEWDKMLRSGNIELSLQLENELMQTINNAIKDNKLADPKTADTLVKLQKVIQSLRPKRQILANLLLFLEELANYAGSANDPAFLDGVQKHLPGIADHIKNRYHHRTE
jgi:hypothetical protein